MTVPLIKAAMKELLDRNIHDLTGVYTQYQRITAQQESPNIVIWNFNMRESRLATGGGMPRPGYTAGVKQRIYNMGTHLRMFGSDPDTDGAKFDDLIEQIEELYRGYPDLDGLADTDMSKILTFAEEMNHERMTVEINSIRILWQVMITCTVTEILNR